MSWPRRSSLSGGTIFVVVVDPVWLAAVRLVVEAGDWRFVAPDNGVLTAVFRRRHRRKSLSDRAPVRPTVSRTFEGAIGLRRRACLSASIASVWRSLTDTS
jgi:S-adenosylmethionine hydrolase